MLGKKNKLVSLRCFKREQFEIFLAKKCAVFDVWLAGYVSGRHGGVLNAGEHIRMVD